MRTFFTDVMIKEVNRELMARNSQRRVRAKTGSYANNDEVVVEVQGFGLCTVLSRRFLRRDGQKTSATTVVNAVQNAACPISSCESRIERDYATAGNAVR